MKTIKSSVPEIKQVLLDSYKNKASQDVIYQIKERSKGRGQGVFVVRVLPAGDIDFYFYYFVDGKPKSKKIGRYGTTKGFLTLAKAKAAFRELSSTYNSGADPKVEEQEIIKKQEKEKLIQNEIERKRQMQGNLGQLAEFFLEHLKNNKGGTHYRNVNQAFAKDLYLIDPETKASEVSKADIIKILHTITERGSMIMANRMRAYLSAMFQYGIYFDDSIETVQKNVQFFITSNPVLTVQKIVKNEKKGDRSLSENEVNLFWHAMDSSNMSTCRINAFKLMLLTGCRVEEIAGLRWSEIDYSEKLITLPPERTKNKLGHIIPLNKIALKIIQNTPKLNDVYLFPAENNTEPLRVDGFSKAISRLTKTAKIEKFVPRDLRRTFKTLTGKAGITKEIRDRLQNHALKDVSSLHYDRYDYLKEKRIGMDVWNDYLTGILSKEPLSF